MSWIDQGRQQHGWFGNGTAPQANPRELGSRAFAAVQLALDDFPNRDDLPFPLEKTTEVLRTFASMMAPEAGLAPSDFRLRFFRASFDPVDAWTVQLIMRGIAAAETHAGLVQSGRELAATTRAHGPDGWNRLLGTAVAHVTPASPIEAANGEATMQKAQFAVPAGPLPLPLPPVFIPGTRENRAMTDATIKGIRRLGSIVTGPFESRRRDEDDELDEYGSVGDPAPARSHRRVAGQANRTGKCATSRRQARSPSAKRRGRAIIRRSRTVFAQSQTTTFVSRRTRKPGSRTRMEPGPIAALLTSTPAPANPRAGRARNATAGQGRRGAVHVR